MTALIGQLAQTDTHSEESPFKPLFTIRRSGRLEVTVYGIVSVMAGSEVDCYPLIAEGDTNFELWSRSLLKPWQLLTNYSILKDNFPGLKDEHLALCMASHSGEAAHIKALEEIWAITGIDESALKCPPASPVDAETKEVMKERGEKARRRYHNCSGKHSGFLAAVKVSQGEDKMKDYLSESAPHHVRLRSILSRLCLRPDASFASTTDGCQLANYALSAAELSYLYMTLLNPGCLTEEAKDSALFADYGELGRIMLKHPRMVSGLGRLDYKIMTGEIFGDAPAMVAKEGADGLLGIGVAANPLFPNGLGIAIKLSAGFDTHHMELITREILTTLGLTNQAAKTTTKVDGVRTDHIKSEYHFLDQLKGYTKNSG
jgi:L-asparaginase II